MRKPFDGDYKQTQGFNDECCRAAYAKFGMKGHNGLDIATPSGTKILAPHDGKVIETTLDPAGYGIYVKIENSIEGSVLAHLREARVGVGDGVKEGDFVGYSDNSGNSTGAHLHWGYYRFPRDRQNGFAGFIDQTPYIGAGTPNLDLQAELDKVRLERDRNWTWFIGLCDALHVPHTFEIAKAEIEKLVKLEDIVREKDQTITLKEQEIIRMKEELSTIQLDLKKTSDANTEAQAAIGDLTKVVGEYKDRAEEEEKVIRQLGDRIEELKKVNPIESYAGIDLIIIGIRRIFGKR